MTISLLSGKVLKNVYNSSCERDYFLIISQTTNFILFQTERVCRRHFNFDENGRKFSKWVENTEGKEEIACHEQFLLFPTVFSKDLFVLQTRKNQVFRKGEIAHDEQFLLFPHSVFERLVLQKLENQGLFNPLPDDKI